MKHIKLLTMFWAALFVLPTVAQTKKVDSSKRAIICLTYDDALTSQLTKVIPQLDSVGLKATFFLPSIQGSPISDVFGQTVEPVVAGWSNAASNGHEIANHTLFHPCPEKFGWPKDFAIESYTIDRIVKEISTQNIFLSLLDPTRKIRAFAYPCNNDLIGDTDYSKIIKDKGLVTFARTGGDKNSIITDFKNLNTMKVPSWLVMEGTTLDELIEFAEKVKKAGGMGVYQFHGVGGENFKITSETHRAFLDYLKAHQADYWVTTFSEAMEFITKKSP